MFLALLLGETLVPPYTQRAFAARDPQASRRGYSVAGIFSFGFFFVTATIGLLAMAKDHRGSGAADNITRHR